MRNAVSYDGLVAEIAYLESECEALETQCAELRAEVAHLRTEAAARAVDLAAPMMLTVRHSVEDVALRTSA